MDIMQKYPPLGRWLVPDKAGFLTIEQSKFTTSSPPTSPRANASDA